MPETTQEEFKRLVELSSADLLKELTETREMFRGYLKQKGIDVPDIVIDEPEQSVADTSNSILLEDFSIKSIKSIDNTVLTVYSTVDAFLTLFDKLPDSQRLEDLTVTVEGHDPCTAKDVQEQIENDLISKDAQVILASSELLSLLPELGGEVVERGEEQEASEESSVSEVKTEKAKALDEKDLESIFDEDLELESAAQGKIKVSEPQAQTAPEVEKAEAEEGGDEEEEELSPLISQELYDELFGDVEKSEETEEEDSDQEEAVDNEEPAADEQESVEKVDSEDVEEESSESLTQEELDKLLAGETIAGAAVVEAVTQEETAEESPEAEDDSTVLSQAELDKLLVGGGVEETPEEPKSETEDDSAVLSQDELDKLLAGGGETAEEAPKAEDDSTVLSQDELDKLLAGGGEEETPTEEAPKAEDGSTVLSQDELDKLLAGKAEQSNEDDVLSVLDSKEPIPQNSEKTSEDSQALSQNELDQLLENLDKVPVVESDDNEHQLSQKELDELMHKEPELPPQVEVQPVVPAPVNEKDFEEKPVLSQDELDKLIAGGSEETPAEESAEAPVAEDDSTALSQDELDKLLAGGGEGAPDESSEVEAQEETEDDSQTLSQNELDQLLGNLDKAQVVESDDNEHQLSQKELDELTHKEPELPPQVEVQPVVPAPVNEKDFAQKPALSQNELDKLFDEKEKKEKNDKQSVESDSTTLSQNELDDLLNGLESKPTEDNEKPNLSQEELDKMFS
jgi:hypothetical protein